MTEFNRNQEAAEIICRDFRWNDRKFKLGEHVALLDGDVVAVADSAETAISALRRSIPNRREEWLFKCIRRLSMLYAVR